MTGPHIRPRQACDVAPSTAHIDCAINGSPSAPTALLKLLGLGGACGVNATGRADGFWRFSAGSFELGQRLRLRLCKHR